MLVILFWELLVLYTTYKILAFLYSRGKKNSEKNPYFKTVSEDHSKILNSIIEARKDRIRKYEKTIQNIDFLDKDKSLCPPSKEISGPLLEDLSCVTVLNNLRNAWGGDYGWGQSPKKRARWMRILSKGDIVVTQQHSGCLLRYFVDSQQMPWPNVPEVWCMQSEKEYARYSNGETDSWTMALQWQSENNEYIKSEIAPVTEKYGISFGVASYRNHKGMSVDIAIHYSLPQEFITFGMIWVNQNKLLELVREFYPTAVSEHSPPWLGRQRLDVYVPELSLAIEYQGEQHYKPLKYFGGRKGLERTRELDKTKAHLCSKNGVHLIHWPHDLSITPESLRMALATKGLRLQNPLLDDNNKVS